MTTFLVLLIATTAAAVGRAVIVSIIAGEVKGALHDRLADRIRRAVKEVPPELADELEDEWMAELEAAKERPLKAIWFVRGLSSAVAQIRRDLAPAPIDVQVSESTQVADATPTRESKPAYISGTLGSGKSHAQMEVFTYMLEHDLAKPAALAGGGRADVLITDWQAGRPRPYIVVETKRVRGPEEGKR